MTSILVTGGTGTLGRLVCERLRQGGHEVRVLSRHSSPYIVDLREGTGLDAAVDGVHTIVHCASTPRGGDVEAAGHLLTAAREAGVSHLVYISIVGVDRVPLGYYRVKREVERMIERAGPGTGAGTGTGAGAGAGAGIGIGWTVLRTTQFHELVLRLLSSAARLPVLPVPSGVSVQPIAAAEAADRLAELALGPPAGRVPDLGGPQIRPLSYFARHWLAATGRRRAVLPVRLPGEAYAAFRAGGHLAPDRAVGRVTFEEFLREHIGG
ncbi:SDR family oxidoreductase [Streptomyces jumonjinensis]|uniref:SDR family oxidoreductase n=1 Tax=Streptomyces jumonjinensis TaxID=1945 RepID=UPI0037B540C4